MLRVCLNRTIAPTPHQAIALSRNLIGVTTWNSRDFVGLLGTDNKHADLCTLNPRRLQSYQKLQREQRWTEQRQNGHARQNTKRRWKQITKMIRQQNKHRR